MPLHLSSGFKTSLSDPQRTLHLYAPFKELFEELEKCNRPTSLLGKVGIDPAFQVFPLSCLSAMGMWLRQLIFESFDYLSKN